MSDQIYTILLVDDDPIIRDKLPKLISASANFRVVDTAHNGASALDKIDHHDFDIVISDLRMPSMHGIELLGKVLQRPNHPIFVAMTAFDTDETMLKLLELGASGYLIKGRPIEETIIALHQAVQGDVGVSPRCVSRLVSIALTRKRFPLVRSRPISLDPTDRKIIVLVSEGKTNRQIAEYLSFAESTIRNRISRLMKATGAASRAQLVAMVNGSKW